MRDLLAGPWVGEFGWELMSWQGRLRRLHNEGHNIWTIGRPQSYPLYADFLSADRYICYEPRNSGDGYQGYLEDSHTESRFQAVLDGCREKLGGNLLCLRPGFFPKEEQDFIRYGDPSNEEPRILVHPRGKGSKGVRGEDDWPAQRWNELLGRLTPHHPVGVIGLTAFTQSIDLQGAEDLRDTSLGRLFDIMRSARAVVGTSSGPMHLASLCGTPHLVWVDEEKCHDDLRQSNTFRYKEAWNPLGTPCRVYTQEDFQPSVESVSRELQLLLSGEFS